MTPEEVAQSTVTATMAALGADAGGLTVRIPDDPACLDVLATSADDETFVTGWRRHSINRPAPCPEIVRSGKPIYIETRGELLARFPIVKKIEEGRRYGGFAGVPVALGDEVLGALSLGFRRDNMVPPEERGLLLSMAAVAFQRARELATAEQGTAPTYVGVACTASLVSDRPKKGDHRCHVAMQTATATTAWFCRRRAESPAMNRVSQSRLAPAETPVSHLTVRPPASSGHSDDAKRIRSTRRSATR